jgi:hypothetical protein
MARRRVGMLAVGTRRGRAAARTGSGAPGTAGRSTGAGKAPAAPHRGAEGVWSYPTEYRGTVMRSRLEARWAGVLDAAGLRWEYEPHTFRLGSSRGSWQGGYVPDFWLPEQLTWLEVKGPHWERIEKTRALAVRLGAAGQVLVATASGVCWRMPPRGRPSQEEVQVGRCPVCERTVVGVPGRAGRLACRVQTCSGQAVPARLLGW